MAIFVLIGALLVSGFSYSLDGETNSEYSQTVTYEKPGEPGKITYGPSQAQYY